MKSTYIHDGSELVIEICVNFEHGRDSNVVLGLHLHFYTEDVLPLNEVDVDMIPGPQHNS